MTFLLMYKPVRVKNDIVGGALIQLFWSAIYEVSISGAYIWGR